MNEEYATTDGTGEVDNRPLIERIGDKVNVICFCVGLQLLNCCTVLHNLSFVRPLPHHV